MIKYITVTSFLFYTLISGIALIATSCTQTLSPSSNSTLTYNDNIVAIVNVSIEIPPTNKSSLFTTYTITPPLPSGLTINSSTGNISGTPKAVQNPTEYTITATNSSDSTISQQAKISILIQTQPKYKAELKTAIASEITRQGKTNQDIIDPDLITINTSKITDMSELFKENTTFNGDISTWDVSKVTNMNAMFQGATAFNQDISKWDVSNVTDMSNMFNGATAFNQKLEAWGNHLKDTVKKTDMFSGSGIETIPSWFNTLMYEDITTITILGSILNAPDVKYPAKWITDNPPPGVTYSIDPTLPKGLSINDGTISGRPTTTHLSTIHTITAIDESNTIYTATITLFIQIQPTTTAELKTAIASEITRQGNEADLIVINTSEITDMSNLIPDLSKTFSDKDAANNFNANFNGDFSTWDVSNVTNMSGMFQGAAAFNSDISTWDVSNVTNMSGMFSCEINSETDACINAMTFNQDISGWKTNSAENMASMFRGATVFNQDISGWNVSKVTDMSYMFNGAVAFNQDISGWNVSSVQDMQFMFSGATAFNQNIGGWDVSKVENMENMFFGATAFDQDIGWDGTNGWDVSKVTTMYAMFQGAKTFNQNIGGWNVSSVTNMRNMFFGATAFNQNISGWNVGNVEFMNAMFQEATAFNNGNDPDTSGKMEWDVSTVTDMSNMFFGATAFNQDIGGWNVSKVENMANMFNGATAFNQNISGWIVSNVTDMQFMFSGATAFNQNIGGWTVSKVTDMQFMFNRATAFNQNIGGWNVSNVENMSNMFNRATAFNQNLEGWNVAATVNKQSMFSGSRIASNPPNNWPSWCKNASPSCE